MARSGEPFSHHKGNFMLPLAGLFLSISSVVFWDPLLTIANNGPGKISMYLPVYAYLFLLNPLNFYLNMLMLHVYATLHICAPEAPMPVLVMKSLPPIVHTVSFATLLLSAPLSVHAAVSEESTVLEILAALVCLALITILASIFKKLLISHTSRGIIPVSLFTLCFSSGSFILLSSENYDFDALTHPTSLHLLLLFGSFFLFMLGITELFRCTDRHHADNCAEKWVIVAQSVAIATLLVFGYVKVYAAVTDMAAVVIEVVEL